MRKKYSREEREERREINMQVCEEILEVISPFRSRKHKSLEEKVDPVLGEGGKYGGEEGGNGAKNRGSYGRIAIEMFLSVLTLSVLLSLPAVVLSLISALLQR